MTQDDFEALKDIMKPCTKHRTYIENGHVIEVAVQNTGWVYYAVELDRNEKFVADRPEHPFSQEIINGHKFEI